MPSLKNIPTNIITGFLGVGKTTAILHLLQQKPANERWAVLVNEFGEVGIDGSLVKGSQTAQQDVYIKEVPGGCMCCAAGLPMQIALNMLLARAKPHRLLIEPTGLGHPVEVMETLASQHYQDLLDLRSTITLVDARKIQNKRYIENNTFTQQLSIADVIVANKSDQYQIPDYPKLQNYLAQQGWLDNKALYQVYMGKIQLNWLDSKATNYTFSDKHTHAQPLNQQVPIEQISKLPDCGYLTVTNHGEGFYSQGWIFKPEFIFDRDTLFSLLFSIKAERVKGVFITNKGVLGFNIVDEVLTEVMLDDAVDSRIELITQDKTQLNNIEDKLLASIIS